MTKREIGSTLFRGGLFFLILILLWVIFMVLTSPSGDISTQLESILHKPGLFKINFVIASLIAPVISFLVWVLGFWAPLKKETPIFNLFGAFF